VIEARATSASCVSCHVVFELIFFSGANPGGILGVERARECHQRSPCCSVRLNPFGRPPLHNRAWHPWGCLDCCRWVRTEAQPLGGASPQSIKAAVFDRRPVSVRANELNAPRTHYTGQDPRLLLTLSEPLESRADDSRVLCTGPSLVRDGPVIGG